MSYHRVVVKLSGEALSGSSNSVIDKETLIGTVEAIRSIINCGAKVLIVVGAGNICRGEMIARADFLDRVSADYMGMLGTIINAIAIENALNRNGIKAKALSSIEIPTFVEKFDADVANKLLDDGYVVVSGGGLGKPFYSTDTAAVMRASEVNADAILMAKNGVDGIYDADPKINPNAKFFKEITPKEIIDLKLKVMDLSAAELLLDKFIDVLVFNNNDLKNFERVVKGENIGTKIKRG